MSILLVAFGSNPTKIMKTFLVILFVLFHEVSFTQSLSQLSGKIINEEGIPISNVHVQIKSTNIGTVSNTQGKFNIKVPKNFCKSDLIFSHISYQSKSDEVVCGKEDYNVILPERTLELEEVKVSAMTAKQIIAKAINNLNNNFQVDSVNYTLFSRLTEQVEDVPVLIEEFVFNLYHEAETKPEFNVIKVRGYGFNKIGKQRFEEARLIDIHSTESHLMLRYEPNFLKINKMKKYEYNLIDEVSEGDELFYVINISSNQYQRGGTIHVNKIDFGIRYLKVIYEDEDWRDMSKTNTVYENFYIKDEGKWFFSHGVKNQAWYLKKQDIKINSLRTTVVTNRTKVRSFDKSDEMGRMSKMLSEFKGRFNDDFWEAYNFIPLEDKFKRSLTDAKNP